MNDVFTFEEINLICIFDTANRTALISELRAAIGDFDTGDQKSDSEIQEIAVTALSKLSGMSDMDFAVLELCPEYGDNDYYEMED